MRAPSVPEAAAAAKELDEEATVETMRAMIGATIGQTTAKMSATALPLASLPAPVEAVAPPAPVRSFMDSSTDVTTRMASQAPAAPYPPEPSLGPLNPPLVPIGIAPATEPTRDVVTEPRARSGPPIANVVDDGAQDPLAAYELLTRFARLPDLVVITRAIVGEAARSRSPVWGFGARVSVMADEVRLSRPDADTRFGNALAVLSTGGEGPAERALASALWAHSVAETPRSKRVEDEDRLAGDILWLATHTAFDATPLLDRALGEDANDLWRAIAECVRRVERGRGGPLSRGEALVGAAALAASASPQARSLCDSLAKEAKDPALRRLLSAGGEVAPDDVRLEGEMLPSPRGVFLTTLLAFTGLLFAIHAVRFIARVALAYKRPAEVSLSESGIRVRTRTVLLGRTLREHEHVILRSALVRVVREVRFPRAAFYAGLLALAIGSYIGVRAFVDGVRAASPSLLVVGLLIVAIGIGADFVLGSLIPGARGRCRLAFTARTGPTLCVGDVDARRADDALASALARR